MSEAMGAAGGGMGKDTPGPSGPSGHGQAPDDGTHGTVPGYPRPGDEITTHGGNTMTSARPTDPYAHGHYDQQEQYEPQEAQHYHPPQAYSAPPPPPGQPPVVGPQAPPQQRTGGGSQGSGVRRPRTGARPLPRTRQARLRVAKTDPWSVMKVSFLLSIALGICTVIAVGVLWMVMDAMGVFSTIGEMISEATETDDDSGFDLEAFLSLQRVLLFTSVIAVIDVVLATALATLGSFMYNISAGFVGGIEVTLAEDE